MKNSLLILTFFCLISAGFGQNLRFSFLEINNGTTSEIKVYVKNAASSGVENMAGFTSNLYYDNTESTLSSFDYSPAGTNLGWSPDVGSTAFAANNNTAILIPHNGFGTINVIDQNFVGADIAQGPVHILTINMDHTVGTSAASEFYLASTTENHPALEYVGNDFIGHPVIVQSFVSFPVEYLDFQATAMEGRATALSWTTASESNNQGFFVQRLQPGALEWESLGFVPGKGNSQSVSSYHFMDSEPWAGENAYRLKQIDFDGAFHHSQVRTVWFEAGFEVSIYPNPTTAILKVRLGETQEAGASSYQLFDMSGRALSYGSLLIEGVNEINVSGLSGGTYILRISLGNRTIEKHIIKMN